jgi:hypothetical protein
MIYPVGGGSIPFWIIVIQSMLLVSRIWSLVLRFILTGISFRGDLH